MKKVLLSALVAYIVCSCATKSVVASHNTPNEESAISVEESAATPSNSENKMVGGWAPVFFVNYDQTQLSDIADKMKNGVVKKVVVSYPKKMQPLAKKIQNYLQQTTSQQVTMDYLELKDTEQVSYNMSQVIVTLYF